MLSFDIRSLEHHGVAVDAMLSPDDAIWQAEDPRPSGPLHVTGRLSTAGAGRFYWHGRIEGDIAMPCRRCLSEASSHVASEEHVIFVDAATSLGRFTLGRVAIPNGERHGRRVGSTHEAETTERRQVAVIRSLLD